MTNTQKGIARLLITALAIAAWMVVFDHIWPADSDTGVAQAPPVSERCPPDPSLPCPSQAAANFNRGLYGRSTGLNFNARVKGMIRDQIAADAAARAVGVVPTDIGDWFQWPFETTVCAMWGAGVMKCASRVDSGQGIIRDGAAWGRVMDDTARVTIKCGGAAVIGFRVGGGWWGAGAGGTSCLWTTMFNHWFPF